MRNSYDFDIQDMLIDVHELGFVRLEWRMLYRWYGAERLTNRVWDDLENRFKEIDDSKGNEGYRLGFLDWDHPSFITFLSLDPEGTKASEQSMKPISAKKK